MQSASASTQQDSTEVPADRRRSEPSSATGSEAPNSASSIALRDLVIDAVAGVFWVGLRSVAAAETVLVALVFHDEFGRTEDS